MIDVENEIFSDVAKVVRKRFPNVFMVGEYVKSPSSFPCVSLVEIGNAVYRKTASTTQEENHVRVSYEVNIYSNKSSGKKAECRAIAKLIDEKLLSLGFTRMTLTPIPNLDDATIYRMLGRYRAVIGRNNTIYRG